MAWRAACLGEATKTGHGEGQWREITILGIFAACFSFHSALTLQLAHRVEVLQVSDVLPLVAIFISYQWHLEQCSLSYYHVITAFGRIEIGIQCMIHFCGILFSSPEAPEPSRKEGNPAWLLHQIPALV